MTVDPPHQRRRDDGLLVVLNLTGGRIADLEDRVDKLERDLADERALRLAVEQLLAAARRSADTRDVHRLEPDATDTRHHDAPARTSSP